MSLKSAAGQWNDSYKLAGHDTAPKPYGDNTTYLKGADFLKGLRVEDWGCGLGWFKWIFTDEDLYTGVDGSKTPFADKIVDLRTYRSSTEGVFMRHVLEHNECWREILRNAVASFTKRFVLVIFTPFQKSTQVIATSNFGTTSNFIDIGFALNDIAGELKPWLKRFETIKTDTQYGEEHVFYCEKKS
jgi:hypothetical protein